MALIQTRSHLTSTNQSEFLKECMVLYEGTLHQFRLEQLSGEHRQQVKQAQAAPGTTKASALKAIDSNASQLVAHAALLQKLAAVYEGIDGAAFGASRRKAKAAIAQLQVRREKEFEVFRDQMKEKREKGTTKMTEDPAAAARKEDARAAVWADMSKQERKAALENVKISKEQLAEANKTTGRYRYRYRYRCRVSQSQVQGGSRVPEGQRHRPKIRSWWLPGRHPWRGGRWEAWA